MTKKFINKNGVEDLGKGKDKGEGAWQEKGVVFLRGGGQGGRGLIPRCTL